MRYGVVLIVLVVVLLRWNEVADLFIAAVEPTTSARSINVMLDCTVNYIAVVCFFINER